MQQHNVLSGEDVARLMTDSSVQSRAEMAVKIADTFVQGAMSDRERALCEEIFRLMARDVEVQVRQSLSRSIRFSPDLPYDVAQIIARDVADVALPLIEVSQVLRDEDLLEIIRSRSVEFQTAVARRPEVSALVSDALVETGNEEVVAQVVGNDGAQLSEQTLLHVLDMFGHNPKISHPMARREVLPMAAAERLVTLVSDKVREHLVTRHALSVDVATDLVLDSRERATLLLIDGTNDGLDVLELVETLHRNNRLTQTLILRALCMGDLTFFEAALARRAGISVANAYQLIYDRGGVGLKRLFDKCEMPPESLKLAHKAILVASDLGQNGALDRVTFSKLMLERILTEFADCWDGENIDYFIAKISGKKMTGASKAA